MSQMCVTFSQDAAGEFASFVQLRTDLRDDGQFGAQVVQPDGGRVDAVDGDGAAGRLDDAEQTERHRALARSRPTHYPDLPTNTNEHVEPSLRTFTSPFQGKCYVFLNRATQFRTSAKFVCTYALDSYGVSSA